MSRAPFAVGDRVRPEELVTWAYTGLSGRPGKDKHAVRRFRKGIWVLEVYARESPSVASRVAAIRTADEDVLFWRETRQRAAGRKTP